MTWEHTKIKTYRRFVKNVRTQKKQHTSIYIYTHIFLFIYLLFIYVIIHLFIHSFIHLFIHSFIYLYLFIYLFIYLVIYLCMLFIKFKKSSCSHFFPIKSAFFILFQGISVHQISRALYTSPRIPPHLGFGGLQGQVRCLRDGPGNGPIAPWGYQIGYGKEHCMVVKWQLKIYHVNNCK